MSRLTELFSRLKRQQKRALIPYVVAGDPSPSGTVQLLHRLVAAGADVLEVGVPFSDPMSEGLVIQLGHERALANGITLRAVLDLVQEFRRGQYRDAGCLDGICKPHRAFWLRCVC